MIIIHRPLKFQIQFNSFKMICLLALLCYTRFQLNIYVIIRETNARILEYIVLVKYIPFVLVLHYLSVSLIPKVKQHLHETLQLYCLLWLCKTGFFCIFTL